MPKHPNPNSKAVKQQAPALPHLIQRDAVYTAIHAQAALGLKRSTLSREFREGRLRVARRAGRRYILGSWLLAWIEAGSELRVVEPNTDGIPPYSPHTFPQ